MTCFSLRDLYETHDRDYLLLCAEVVERTIFIRSEAMRQAKSRGANA